MCNQLNHKSWFRSHIHMMYCLRNPWLVWFCPYHMQPCNYQVALGIPIHNCHSIPWECQRNCTRLCQMTIASIHQVFLWMVSTPGQHILYNDKRNLNCMLCQYQRSEWFVWGLILLYNCGRYHLFDKNMNRFSIHYRSILRSQKLCWCCNPN